MIRAYILKDRKLVRVKLKRRKDKRILAVSPNKKGYIDIEQLLGLLYFGIILVAVIVIAVIF